MEISEITTSVLCVISPFAIGWLILSIAVGIRGGLETGFRLFLFGLGLLGIFFAFSAIFFFLPDWVAIAFMLVLAFTPWIATLRYLVATKISGRLLMALPLKHGKWRTSIIAGAFFVILGLQVLITDGNLLTPAKSYALGTALISLGVFRTIQRIRYTQIREKGMLYESGDFYKWENIENYTWKFGEDKLVLHLKKFIFKRIINLKILSQFRHEVLTYLSKNIHGKESTAEYHIEIQKAV